MLSALRVGVRRTASAPCRRFAAGAAGGNAPPKAEPPLSLGVLGAGVAVGGGIGVGIYAGGKTLGTTLGDRVQAGLENGLKTGGAYIGAGVALSSSVAGVFYAAFVVGTQLLRRSHGAEQAGGDKAPPSAGAPVPCAGAPVHARADCAPADAHVRRGAGNGKPAQSGRA